MEGQTQTFVDTRPPQENQQTNPIVKSRQSTDRFFIYLFLIIIVAWLGIGISAFCAHQPEINSKSTYVDNGVIYKSILNAPVISFNFGLIVLIVICSFVMYFFIFLKKKFADFFVYCGIVIYILYQIRQTAEVFGLVSNSRIMSDIIKGIPPPFVMVYQIYFALNIIFLILSLFSLLNVEKSSMFNVIKDVFGFILDNPLMILFIGLICLLGYGVFSFSINAVFLEAWSDRSRYHVVFDCFVIIAGGMSAHSFLYNFALMVVSEYSVNHYWKNPVSIGESISQISRNHLGTIMFSSISGLFIPYIFAIYQALIHRRSWTYTENSFFYFVNKICLTLNMPCFALFYSSIYGTGFVKSIQKTFDTVLRHNVLYLATLGVFDALLYPILIVLSVVGAIGAVISIGIVDLEKVEIHTAEGFQVLIKFTVIIYGILYPYMIFYTLIYNSARSLLLNKIIILNKENQYTEGKTEILNRL